MKKLLLLLSLVCIRQVNAQCPVTITGDTVCAGSCATLTATGALTYQWMPYGQTTSTISACIYNTTYTVTGYGSGGCVSTQTINLFIAIPPSLSVSIVNASCPTCNDGQITTMASGSFPFTFTWMPIGTISGTGSTSIYSNAGPGTYTVCVSDANGCTTCSTSTVSTSTTTGINISSTNTQFNIYPNPTNDQFFIDANTTEKLTADLHDVNGRQVYSANVSGKSTIDVSSLNEGVYTLTIKMVDGVVNKKLVIVR